MRDFIMMTERLIEAERQAQVCAEAAEAPTIVRTSATLLEDLSDVVFKLRAFMGEGSDAEMYGIELGMQRAADMIEQTLGRHKGDVVG